MIYLFWPKKEVDHKLPPFKGGNLSMNHWMRQYASESSALMMEPKGGFLTCDFDLVL